MQCNGISAANNQYSTLSNNVNAFLYMYVLQYTVQDMGNFLTALSILT